MSANLSINSGITQFRFLRPARSSVSARFRPVKGKHPGRQLDWRVSLTLVLLVAWGGASRAQAQETAHFSYAQSTIGSGLKLPGGRTGEATGGGNAGTSNGR